MESYKGHVDTDQKVQRAAIIGAGALGRLLAARLQPFCAQLLLVTRTKEQADAISGGGGIQLVDGTEHILADARTAALEGPGEAVRLLQEMEPEWIVLAVKQQHINGALAESVQRAMGVSTRLLLLQNGIGHVERLLAAGIDPDRMYAAVTTEGAKAEDTRRVIHTGRGLTRIGPAVSKESGGSELHSGPLYRETVIREAQGLIGLLSSAGFTIQWTNPIAPYVWSKLVMNALINPLTAILRIRNGELLESPHALDLMRRLFNEALRIAGAEGVPLSPGLWEEVLQVCVRTAANSSSMLQDVLAGRPTELDWITGALLRAAEKYGMDAPSHRAVYLLMKAIEGE
ncbi:2-dehydropantoate 2-reductase [Paenibacillus sp. y28]|uniref:2-dehydropantoate 2-reductase n=1 Tax=Paenibacillus sp. y28 TaxID=3129110 RepID=UPI003017C61F